LIVGLMTTIVDDKLRNTRDLEERNILNCFKSSRIVAGSHVPTGLCPCCVLTFFDAEASGYLYLRLDIVKLQNRFFQFSYKRWLNIYV